MNEIIKIEQDLNKIEARAIISQFSFAHASVALLLANTLIGDTAVLTGLTFWMIHKLGDLYGASNLNPKNILAKIFGFLAGTYIAGKLLFFVPVIGNIANATETVVVTQIIGWTCVAMFKAGKNIDELSDEELRKIVDENREQAEQNAEEMRKILKALSRNEKKTLRAICKKLRNKNLSDEEKEKLLDEFNLINEGAKLKVAA